MEDPIIFEDLMEIIIHEIAHVLGFSDGDANRWVNSDEKHYTNPILKI